MDELDPRVVAAVKLATRNTRNQEVRSAGTVFFAALARQDAEVKRLRGEIEHQQIVNGALKEIVRELARRFPAVQDAFSSIALDPELRALFGEEDEESDSEANA